eukprot:scaffold871_cov130-Cylindrotheca_fusiformis.AAC.29
MEPHDPTVLTQPSSTRTVGPSDFNRSSSTNSIKLDLLTVFQAAPLAFNDQAIPELGLDFERNILQNIFERSQVVIDFQIGTFDTLGEFLARSQGRALHFSCHGDEHRLFLEDNWGGVWPLQTQQIKDWIGKAGTNLQFVFVSACFSRNIGQAFVDADVPHVVCCDIDSEVDDLGAAEFAKIFYRNLIHGKTVEEAFVIAHPEFLAGSTIPAKIRGAEVKKFCLLPRDGNHNVPVFPQQPIPITRKQQNVPPMQFPPPSHLFIGRQLDQKSVLDALKSSRLVCVSGARGVGKADMVKAVCARTNRRLRLVDIRDIVWVPYQEEIRSGEPFCYFQALMKIFNDSSPTSQFSDKARRHIDKLAKYYRLPKTLLVIDAKEFSTVNGLGKLGLFLEEFIKETENVKVIVIHQLLKAEIVTTIEQRMIRRESLSYNDKAVMNFISILRLCVKPLSYDDSVELFAKLCPSRTRTRTELDSLLVLPEIFATIDGGNPERIRNLASKMRRDQTENRSEELGKSIRREASTRRETNAENANLVEGHFSSPCCSFRSDPRNDGMVDTQPPERGDERGQERNRRGENASEQVDSDENRRCCLGCFAIIVVAVSCFLMVYYIFDAIGRSLQKYESELVASPKTYSIAGIVAGVLCGIAGGLKTYELICELMD